MYIAVIFADSNEGVEGDIVVGEDLRGVQQRVESVVDAADSEGNEYEWQNDNTAYYPVGDPKYGTFPWAKIYSAYEYERVSFSEYA